jgi:CO/xanthine dehydrogenase FAD-binding subunit
MLKNLKNFYRPRSIADACTLLDSREKNIVLAGGTHLGVIEDSSVEGLVDLKHLSLSYVRKDSRGYRIGAMTPVYDLSMSSMLTGPSGNLIRKACSTIGSTLLRHAITAGGNCVSVFPWSDLPPVFLALDASFVISDGKRERVVPAATFFAESPREILGQTSLLTEIQVPEYPAGTGTAFHKVAKTKNDFATITVAVRLDRQQETITNARIALNAVVRKPSRCSEAEQLLLKQTASATLFEKAGQAAVKGLVFTADIRETREYRAEVLPVYVRRCLSEAAGQESLGKN